jgi:hypothetical protein
LKESAISKIEAHEKELEDGAARFDRLENMMWGVYPFMLACLAVAKFT